MTWAATAGLVIVDAPAPHTTDGAPMPLLKTALAILVLLLAGTCHAGGQAAGRRDHLPDCGHGSGAGATIATGDKLYLRISYESQVPVRFQIEAFRQALRRRRRYQLHTPYNAGQGEALAWISFSAPLRVDEIRVTAFDMEWQELHHQTSRWS